MILYMLQLTDGMLCPQLERKFLESFGSATSADVEAGSANAAAVPDQS